MVGKKIKGRKRHIVMDTQGDLLHATVHAANIHDTKVGGPVFEAALKNIQRWRVAVLMVDTVELPLNTSRTLYTRKPISLQGLKISGQ